MKEEIREYYPNGRLKHVIKYHDNSRKRIEYFHDKNNLFHRKNIPAIQYWSYNGMLRQKTYCYHGVYHNICGPADIVFQENGKILEVAYHLRYCWMQKLEWMNCIKKI